MIALVGSSGAGKSTIAQLLPRLYDADAGSVRLNGIDVRDLSADSIRDTLGMVTQDGHLFHESVRANLLLARPDASEEDIWDALRRSRLEGLIASLPEGLDTVVGERGYRLSGVSVSGSPSPGCCWPVSGSSSWTRRPRTWTPPPRPPSRRPWPRRWRGGPPW